jgi:hypothetical protein
MVAEYWGHEGEPTSSGLAAWSQVTRDVGGNAFLFDKSNAHFIEKSLSSLMKKLLPFI